MSEDLGRKYEFTGKALNMEIRHRTVYEIRAVRNFGRVEKGELGGYIEKEDNLSHDGECWVAKDAIVLEDAEVYENAYICGNTIVYNNAKIYGDSFVSHGLIRNDAEIYGEAYIKCQIVGGKAKIHDKARIINDAVVLGDVEIYGDVTFICDNARIENNGSIKNTEISGNAVIKGNTRILNSYIYDNVMVLSGIIGDVKLFDNAKIELPEEGDINDESIGFNHACFGKEAYITGRKTYVFISNHVVDITVYSTKDSNVFVYLYFTPCNHESFTLQEAIDFIKETDKIDDKEKNQLLVMILGISNYLLSL